MSRTLLNQTSPENCAFKSAFKRDREKSTEWSIELNADQWLVWVYIVWIGESERRNEAEYFSDHNASTRIALSKEVSVIARSVSFLVIGGTSYQPIQDHFALVLVFLRYPLRRRFSIGGSRYRFMESWSRICQTRWIWISGGNNQRCRVCAVQRARSGSVFARGLELPADAAAGTQDGAYMPKIGLVNAILRCFRQIGWATFYRQWIVAEFEAVDLVLLLSCFRFA